MLLILVFYAAPCIVRHVVCPPLSGNIESAPRPLSVDIYFLVAACLGLEYTMCLQMDGR